MCDVCVCVCVRFCMCVITYVYMYVCVRMCVCLMSVCDQPGSFSSLARIRFRNASARFAISPSIRSQLISSRHPSSAMSEKRSKTESLKLITQNNIINSFLLNLLSPSQYQ